MRKLFESELIQAGLPRIPAECYEFFGSGGFVFGSTVKSAEALDKDEIAKFCGILTIDMTQSSVLQVWRVYVVEGGKGW